MIKAVFYDLDGTLAYTVPDLMANVNRMRHKKGLCDIGLKRFMKGINGTTREFVASYLPKGKSEEYYEDAVKCYKEMYSAHAMDNTTEYEGMRDSLLKLKERGYIVSIISNKDDTNGKKIAEKLFGENIFTDVIGPDHMPGKPDPTSALYLCKKYGIKPNEVVYVGDSDTDIKTAQNAGMNLICVSWGYRDEKFLKENGAKYFAHKPIDVLSIINIMDENN